MNMSLHKSEMLFYKINSLFGDISILPLKHGTNFDVDCFQTVYVILLIQVLILN